MARKAGKIYGTERDKTSSVMINNNVTSTGGANANSGIVGSGSGSSSALNNQNVAKSTNGN